jgi:hypothetical protein
MTSFIAEATVKFHLRELKKSLVKQVGKKCKEYDRFCFTCINWEAFDALEDTFKIKL